MKSMTIGKRVTTGFIALVIIALIIGTFASVRLSSIDDKSGQIAAVNIPMNEIGNNIRYRSQVVSSLTYRHLGAIDAKDMAELDKQIKEVRVENVSDFNKLKELVAAQKDAKLSELVVAFESARNEYGTILDAVLALSRQGTNNVKAYQMARNQMDPCVEKYIKAMLNVSNACNDKQNSAFASIVSMVRTTRTSIFVALVVILTVGLGAAFFIVRGMNRVLTSVAENLKTGSEQVAAAAGQIAASSQTQAEGASEQAASLEETSSSLEEIASMTKSNTQSTQKAKDLAGQARQAADVGAEDMKTMNQAMEGIKNSSSEIAKIIKTIDEIAFQTNILALNAAVEAARAGEAGMGFAVVADEVRNLAQRSASAAKETSDKIEGAISRTEQGVQISMKVYQGLQNIVEKVREVDQLVAEVASASMEQSQGIDQLNVAVSQMDHVTQSNAASAEESASASEELNAQAESLHHSVIQLLTLVEGEKSVTSENRIIAKKVEVDTHNPPSYKGKKSKPALPKPGEKKAGVIEKGDIPMDDDFK